MTFNEPPFSEPPSERTPVYAAALRGVASLLGVVLIQRERTARRFCDRICWRRVLALGVMLAGLAGVPVMSLVADGFNGRYFPGMASLFGGLLQTVLIMKIASPDVYADWIFMGLCDVLIGALLLVDPGLAAGLSLAAFLLCFALSALIRVWIGLTFRAANAFTWIGSSGLVGLFLLAWFVLAVVFSSDVKLDLPMASDLVLRADLTLRGVALMGFGLSLRNRDE